MFIKIVFNSRLNIIKILNIENVVVIYVVIVFRIVIVKNFIVDFKLVNKMYVFRLRKKNCYCMLLLFNYLIFLNCVFFEYVVILYMYLIRIVEIVIFREEVYLFL